VRRRSVSARRLRVWPSRLSPWVKWNEQGAARDDSAALSAPHAIARSSTGRRRLGRAAGEIPQAHGSALTGTTGRWSASARRDALKMFKASIAHVLSSVGWAGRRIRLFSVGRASGVVLVDGGGFVQWRRGLRTRPASRDSARRPCRIAPQVACVACMPGVRPAHNAGPMCRSGDWPRVHRTHRCGARGGHPANNGRTAPVGRLYDRHDRAGEMTGVAHRGRSRHARCEPARVRWVACGQGYGQGTVRFRRQRRWPCLGAETDIAESACAAYR